MKDCAEAPRLNTGARRLLAATAFCSLLAAPSSLRGQGNVRYSAPLGGGSSWVRVLNGMSEDERRVRICGYGPVASRDTHGER
ncbi:MAG: hypothetical protein ACC661_12495, partial [Verrucomicrobiales bacterium]